MLSSNGMGLYSPPLACGPFSLENGNLYGVALLPLKLKGMVSLPAVLPPQKGGILSKAGHSSPILIYNGKWTGM